MTSHRSTWSHMSSWPHWPTHMTSHRSTWSHMSSRTHVLHHSIRTSHHMAIHHRSIRTRTHAHAIGSHWPTRTHHRTSSWIHAHSTSHRSHTSRSVIKGIVSKHRVTHHVHVTRRRLTWVHWH